MKKRILKKLSIIIVSYNTEKLTVSCIRSILRYAPSFSFEIIVVDNASTDESVQKIKEFMQKNNSTYKKTIRLYTNDKNNGFSKANNIGIKHSQGEYVLLLNSDTELQSDVLSALLNFGEKLPKAGVVAPQLLNPDKTIQPSIFHLPTVMRAIQHYWLFQPNTLSKYALNGDVQEVESVVGAAFLITPSARKKVGLLPEKYFMYMEDLDYCRSVRKAGLKVYYVPSLSVVHVHGGSSTASVNKYLISSSKKYHGIVRYYLYTFILWSGQKLHKIF